MIFYNLAEKNITTVELINKNKPTGSNLPISDKDDMKIFKDNSVFILKNLGIIDFTEKKDKEEKGKQKSDVFYIRLTSDRISEDGKRLCGKLIIDQDKYILLKGSYIEGKVRESFKNHNYYKLRKKIERENKLSETKYDNIYSLDENLPFSSPSAAGAVVKNRATNGRKEWKLDNGTTLDDYENNMVINE